MRRDRLQLSGDSRSGGRPRPPCRGVETRLLDTRLRRVGGRGRPPLHSIGVFSPDAFPAVSVQRVMKRWIALGLLLLVAVPLRAVGASTLTTVYLFAIAFAFIGNALMRIEA